MKFEVFEIKDSGPVKRGSYDYEADAVNSLATNAANRFPTRGVFVMRATGGKVTELTIRETFAYDAAFKKFDRESA